MARFKVFADKQTDRQRTSDYGGTKIQMISNLHVQYDPNYFEQC